LSGGKFAPEVIANAIKAGNINTDHFIVFLILRETGRIMFMSL